MSYLCNFVAALYLICYLSDLKVDTLKIFLKRKLVVCQYRFSKYKLQCFQRTFVLQKYNIFRIFPLDRSSVNNRMRHKNKVMGSYQLCGYYFRCFCWLLMDNVACQYSMNNDHDHVIIYSFYYIFVFFFFTDYCFR